MELERVAICKLIEQIAEQQKHVKYLNTITVLDSAIDHGTKKTGFPVLWSIGPGAVAAKTASHQLSSTQTPVSRPSLP